MNKIKLPYDQLRAKIRHESNAAWNDGVVLGMLVIGFAVASALFVLTSLEYADYKKGSHKIAQEWKVSLEDVRDKNVSLKRQLDNLQLGYAQDMATIQKSFEHLDKTKVDKPETPVIQNGAHPGPDR